MAEKSGCGTLISSCEELQLSKSCFSLPIDHAPVKRAHLVPRALNRSNSLAKSSPNISKLPQKCSLPSILQIGSPQKLICQHLQGAEGFSPHPPGAGSTLFSMARSGSLGLPSVLLFSSKKKLCRNQGF